MIKLKVSCVVAVFSIICGISFGEVSVPAGTQYAPPVGGTLVVSEDYGTDNDGTGTWSDAGGGVLSTTNDSMIVSVDNNYAYLPLPWRPRATNYVIDIGIKSWSTTQTGATEYSAAWYLENNDGNSGNYSVSFIMRPGGDLYTSSTELAPFAQNTEHVVRFSDPTGTWAPYSAVATLNLGQSVTRESGAGYRILEDALLLQATAEGRNAEVEISWIRVYEGITSTDAPLQTATEPEVGYVWTPGSSEYLPPAEGNLVISEDFGSESNRDGSGSWTLGGNAVLEESSDYVTISFAEGDSGDATIYLPFEPRNTDYVIDVGLMGWERLGGVAAYNSSWMINSVGSTSGMRHYWAGTDNLIKAIYSGNEMAYYQEKGYVIRFSNPGSRAEPAMILNYASDDEICVEGSTWGSTTENYFRLYGASTGASNNKIAWIRVYEGVSTDEAPLEEIPMWTPAGTTYLPPSGGTLVMDEVYGSSNPDVIGTSDPNNMGSWSLDGGGNVTIASDGLIASVADNYVHMALPWRPASQNYVIDVGVKGWSTTSGSPTSWAGIWGLENSDRGQRQVFIMRPGNGGELFTLAENLIPLPQNNEHVIRFSDPSGPWAPYTCYATVNFGDSILDEGGTGGMALDALRLSTGTGQNCTLKIAWVKVYEDVTSTDAPLAITNYLIGDISGANGKPDFYVDIYDFMELASQWLTVTE
jgi:hypothetical protein